MRQRANAVGSAELEGSRAGDRGVSMSSKSIPGAWDDSGERWSDTALS
jgi:hypothetical protein